MIGLYHKALHCNTNATQRKGRKKEEKRTKREVNKRSKRNSLVIFKDKKNIKKCSILIIYTCVIAKIYLTGKLLNDINVLNN